MITPDNNSDLDPVFGIPIEKDQTSLLFSAIGDFYKNIKQTPKGIVRQRFIIRNDREDDERALGFLFALIDEWVHYPSPFEILGNGLAKLKTTVQQMAGYALSEEFQTECKTVFATTAKICPRVQDWDSKLSVELCYDGGTLFSTVKQELFFSLGNGEPLLTITMSQSMYVLGMTPEFKP